MNIPKTWCDLLGRNTHNCSVDGRDIIRYEFDGDRCLILWTAENHLQALAIMEAWRHELGE